MTDARIEAFSRYFFSKRFFSKYFFSKCYTSVVHDVLRARGFKDVTLPPRITAFQPEMTLCGPARTIEGVRDETADPHQTMLDWTGLLSRAAPGYIWCAQPNTHLIAQMGELSAETLHAKGVLGCVLDGGLRDAHFILDLGFPCWRTHHIPRDVVGMWRPTATEAPITIGMDPQDAYLKYGKL
jgi:regulator of RNase E activity RraA